MGETPSEGVVVSSHTNSHTQKKTDMAVAVAVPLMRAYAYV